jgi:hypothetical protein
MHETTAPMGRLQVDSAEHLLRGGLGASMAFTSTATETLLNTQASAYWIYTLLPQAGVITSCRRLVDGCAQTEPPTIAVE